MSSGPKVDFEKQQHKALFPAGQSSPSVRGLFQYMKASVLAVRDVTLESPLAGPLVPDEAKTDEAKAEAGRQQGQG